jgi:hypothetical protein
VLGSFQLTIPVSTKSEILVPEEQLYSVMRWVQETIPPANRWRPVFHRYVGRLAGKIVALGGDPNAIPPTGTGVWPGLGGHEPAGDSHAEVTGNTESSPERSKQLSMIPSATSKLSSSRLAPANGTELKAMRSRSMCSCSKSGHSAY